MRVFKSLMTMQFDLLFFLLRFYMICLYLFIFIETNYKYMTPKIFTKKFTKMVNINLP